MASDEIIDFGRQFVDEDGCFLFGKHKGEYLDDLAREEPSYLKWCLESIGELPESVREDIEGALGGRRFRHRTPVVAASAKEFPAAAVTMAPLNTIRCGKSLERVSLTAEQARAPRTLCPDCKELLTISAPGRDGTYMLPLHYTAVPFEIPPRVDPPHQLELGGGDVLPFEISTVPEPVSAERRPRRAPGAPISSMTT